MCAPKFKLDNLVVILDHNNGQIDGPVNEVMDLEPIADKWRAFNWNVLTIDGHDYEQIAKALDRGARHQGQADVHHRRDGQGQGRLVHGGARSAGTASPRPRTS